MTSLYFLNALFAQMLNRKLVVCLN